MQPLEIHSWNGGHPEQVTVTIIDGAQPLSVGRDEPAPTTVGVKPLPTLIAPNFQDWCSGNLTNVCTPLVGPAVLSGPPPKPAIPATLKAYPQL